MSFYGNVIEEAFTTEFASTSTSVVLTMVHESLIGFESPTTNEAREPARAEAGFIGWYRGLAWRCRWGVLAKAMTLQIPWTVEC